MRRSIGFAGFALLVASSGCAGDDPDTNSTTSGGASGTAGGAGTIVAGAGSGGSSGSGGGNVASGGSSGTGAAPAAGGTSAGTGGEGGSSGTGGGGAAGMTSAGCGMSPVAAGEASVNVPGQGDRTYLIDLPSSYDPNTPYPLLFGFHGATTSGSAFRSQYYGNLPAAAGAEAILVHPNAAGEPTAWDNATDLEFFDAMLEQIESRYCVDTARIFATGHSSGGFFSNTLGCQRAGVLRGIAPVSGGGPFGGSCSGNVAVWAAHGADDETVDVMLGQDSVEGWTTRNGCDFATSSPVEPSPCVEYGSCQSGFPVRYCEYAGGHEWPDFAPQALWNFFKSL